MNKAKKRFFYVLLALFVFGVCTVVVAAAPAQVYAAAKKNGWVNDKNGKKCYYYINGAAQKGIKKISGKLYYFDTKTAKLAYNKRAIKSGGKYYKSAANGVATQITEVEWYAGRRVDALAGNTKNKAQLARKAFDWSAKKIKYRVIKAPSKNVAAYYGLIGFKNGYGDCYVQAATFYWMLKSIGYKDMLFVKGTVPKSKDVKVQQPHGWVERKVGNKYYFFDPSAAGEGKAKVTWCFLYGTPGSLKYKDSHNHKVQYKK